MAVLICGIDEAGRGCFIGSMFICGVIFKESDLHLLEESGVKDSKKLTPRKRTELCKFIVENCENYKVIEVTVKEIDEREQNNLNLNQLEVLKFAEILNILKPDEAYLDAADVNEERFKANVEKKISTKIHKIVSKHKADDLYPIVSAASIIAKTIRDKKIYELQKKYGKIGSGYPSDDISINFFRNWLKTKKSIPEFVRKSWDTTKKLVDSELFSKKITDYF